jgi:hypothetical protein
MAFTVPAIYATLIDLNDDGDFLDANEDFSSRILQDPPITIERGRDQIRALAPPAAGKMDARADNRDRLLSTENTGSAIYASLYPGHRVRHQCVTNSTTYVLGTGILDDLPQYPGLGDRSVGLPCLGTLSRLRAADKVTTTLFVGITTDVALGAILDAVGWPAGERSLQTGKTTLNYWWLDDADPFSAVVTLLNTEGPGATIYEDGRGYFVFENRHSRVLTARSNTPQATFRDSGTAPYYLDLGDFTENFRGVINRVSIPVNVRAAAASQVIWQLGQTLVLPPGATAKFVVRHTVAGAVGQAGQIFQSAIAPVDPTDYTVIAGGVASVAIDRTAGLSLTLTITAVAGGGILGGGGATITGLQLRASPVPAQAVEVRETIDTSASVAKYGLRPYAADLWPEIDLGVAQDFANAIVGAYSAPRPTATLTIRGDDPAHLEQCLTREVSDRITVVNAQTGLNADCTIERIGHSIRGQRSHTTTFGVEKVAPGALPMIFDYGKFDFNVFGY